MLRNIGFGQEHLAPYATKASQSRGRLFQEPDSPTRTPFQRDRDRIIHSTAFRRLNHKTQVFIYHEGDHYRTRLTHSMEVAQIARALARALRVDEDLAEALALSHDFGHTPFGHTGEEALDAKMAAFGGFDHNAQSLKIVTELERYYAEFDGLNLCWESLEGLVKHNGPMIDPENPHSGAHLPKVIGEFNARFDLDLDKYSGIEAQCAAIADDIAYNAHDLDDGLRAGLFELDALEDLPVTGKSLMRARTKFTDISNKRLGHEVVRRQITAMVEDVIDRSMENLTQIDPMSDQDVRCAGRGVVEFSPEMEEADAAIKHFLFRRMYRAPTVMAVREHAATMVGELFDVYYNDINALPNHVLPDHLQAIMRDNREKRAHFVSDFIAGMTDRYAMNEHKRLFDVTPDLR